MYWVLGGVGGAEEETAGKGKPGQGCWANDQAGQRLRVGGGSSCMRRAPLKVVRRHDADCLFV